ncbi:MAG: rod shape-determining protein RodA [Chloroflexi bacterium]|nr:rod shape-determining protein RodA [Chloroflexota bacterium]
MSRPDWRSFDWLLSVAMLALTGLGIAMIYSGYESLFTEPSPLWENTVFRQSLFAGIGLAVYLLSAAIDYHVWLRLSRWLYVGIVALLAVTLALGRTQFGATSWLRSGVFGVQPSELAKVLVILLTARQLGVDREQLQSPLPFISAALLLVPPVVLIYFQPDFGTALMVAISWIGIVFLSGVRWRHLLALPVLGAAAAPVIWFRLEDYMRDRVLTFLLPGYDPSGASYNIQQALISIGSGGWLGKGFGQGTQSQLEFLRVRHTDFIFSVLAEELGFVGASLTVVLFAVIVLRLLRIARLARDDSGRLIAAGVATMILAQTVTNLGMNANLLPVTGLPLPLVSYGGSSLVTTFLALGLTQSVVLRHKDPDSTLF